MRRTFVGFCEVDLIGPCWATHLSPNKMPRTLPFPKDLTSYLTRPFRHTSAHPRRERVQTPSTDIFPSTPYVELADVT